MGSLTESRGTWAASASICVLAALLGLLVGGCGDSCNDLQAVCDTCVDPNHKARCEQAASCGRPFAG
jgi:hypothetical protein